MPPYGLAPIGLPDDAPRLDRDAVLLEVARGLPCERERLACALENQAYADLEHEPYEEMRESETQWDFVRRPRKATGFVHQALGRLCAHTYSPGPHRSADVPAADRILQQVYTQNHIDALMHEAERLSTINDVAAIQVRWTRGRGKGKDVDLQLWGAEEFAVFESPDDPREAEAVVTIDKVDNATRYRVWFDDLVHTFSTAKAGGQDGRRTEGGVIAYEEVGSPRPNPYGAIPFAFVHYRQPTRCFWTNAPGSFLRRTEATVNVELSDLAEAIVKYATPIGLLINFPVEDNPEIGPGRFLRLIRGGPTYSGDGYSDGGEPDARYLQAQLAIEAIWEDIRHTLDQAAEACDLSPGALRLDYSDAPSGFSLVCRQFPLLDRARGRRPIFQRAETELARTICAVYGAMAGDAAIRSAAATVCVLAAWPEPTIPVPGPDRDQSDAWEIGLGIKSRLQVIGQRYGLATREQQIAHLKQVAADEREAEAILPRPEAPPPAAGPGGPERGPDDGGEDDEDDR